MPMAEESPPPTMSTPTPPKKVQPIVYFIGLTAALAGLLFGLDIGVISGAQLYIQKDFGLTDQVIEWIVSALLWGAVLGALASGFASNKFGRRKTLLFSAILFTVGSVVCALAPNAHFLIGARFVLGIAVGVASFTAPLYLAEIAPQSVRGAMISMYQLMITIGILVAFLSDTFFAAGVDAAAAVGAAQEHLPSLANPEARNFDIWLYNVIDTTRNHEVWRWMLGVIALPAILMGIGVLFLPESPRWLFLNGFQKSAEHVFRRLHLDDAEIASEVEQIQESVKVPQKGLSLFRQNPHFRRAVFLGIGLQIIQQLTGINVIMYYAPRIFEMAGFASTSQQMWGTVVVGLTNVLATFIAIAFVDRLGRKPIMYAGFVVMGVALLTVGTIFHLMGDGPAQAGLAYPAAFALLLFIVGFAMSAGPIIWVLCSEIYPLAGRDFGITCSTGTNWVANAIVGMTFLTLVNGFGAGNTFLLYGAFNLLFIVVFLLLVPETKGVSLEKIESNLLAGLPLKKIGR
jgi:SP family galactose:H+ symporter-like MFS transporter